MSRLRENLSTPTGSTAWLIGAALAALLLVLACGVVAMNTTIAEIHNDPPGFEGKTVRLEGEVTSRLSSHPDGIS